MGTDPKAATWLWGPEDRTPTLKLQANPHYWDAARGPRLREVEFRNDLEPHEALRMVCDSEGEVDLVTEVAPADAARVETSPNGKLVKRDAVRAVVGIIDREAEGLPMADRRARLALNLAVDRVGLVREALRGHGTPLAGLSPQSSVPRRMRLSPPAHDPRVAGRLWQEAAGGSTRPIRLAAPEKYREAAGAVAVGLRSALNVGVEVTILGGLEMREARRGLAERRTSRGWDVLVYEQAAQAVDSVGLEFHRAFAGESGEYRAGPVVPAFEEIYAEFGRSLAPSRQVKLTGKMDRLVRDEALVLSLFAPRVLYAVNRHVSFTPYRTSFELAETSVSRGHWSRR